MDKKTDNKMLDDRKPGTKKNFTVKIAIVAVAMVVILAVGLMISDVIDSTSGKSSNGEFTIDPSKLHETKEKEFDIMEYEEYLDLNRVIIFSEKDTGVSYSLDDSNFTGFGEDVRLMYELISAVIAGDSEKYNDLVHKDVGHYESFTQQQIYDIFLTRESKSSVNANGNTYTEYVMKVEYKIHENNGSFRSDIESDASRPQYFVIDNSTGELLIMNVVTVRYSN